MKGESRRMTPTAPNTVTNKVPELVAPAGNDEKLSTVLHYGADAVYLGLADFSLRAKAKTLSRKNSATL